MKLWTIYRKTWWGKREFIGIVEAPDYTLALGVASFAGLLPKGATVDGMKRYEDWEVKRLKSVG
jgi:hypothetical protein